MRRRLLNFYYNPDANTLNLDGHGREINKFQRDVGEPLSRAGFRLIPEYEVAGRFIDWVVEDRERRLAIECDGDTWHGPDQYEADMARQRMLERCGWKFVRIRGSVFYANQSKAMEGLIDAIRAHGLEPYKSADDESVPRDWIAEVSGQQCMEALGAQAVAKANENIVEQRDLFQDESEPGNADGFATTMESATAAEPAERRQAQASGQFDPAGVQRLLGALVDGSAATTTPVAARATPDPPTTAAPAAPKKHARGFCHNCGSACIDKQMTLADGRECCWRCGNALKRGLLEAYRTYTRSPD
jgi:very-short-patch-repair endonuclease